MELKQFNKIRNAVFEIPQQAPMKVAAFVYANEKLMEAMDQKVYEQLKGVSQLPGIVKAAYAMPDAHWGYGFPIGGVAAFDPKREGVVSAGGVGFDISCGVRMLRTELSKKDIQSQSKELADTLFHTIPAGVGSRGKIHLKAKEMEGMLQGGARWAVEQGYGSEEDLEWIEDRGEIQGALPEHVSEKARRRQREEMGTLGSGNHYLEVQEVDKVFDHQTAKAFGLEKGQIVISTHCGSRGLGHQIGTEYLKEMAKAAHSLGIELPDRELASAPINSREGQAYLGAMRAAMNCALANRQIISHLTRNAFNEIFPGIFLPLVYDVSHNTCKEEEHWVDGEKRRVYVHRKGATRAFGPGHSDLPSAYQSHGQPIFIGGTMGTSSYVLCGLGDTQSFSFQSACHGAGRAMSRRQAAKQWHGSDIIQELAQQGISIRSTSKRGVAEEAPGAYKDVESVVMAAEEAQLAKAVVQLKPLVCIKG